MKRIIIDRKLSANEFINVLNLLKAGNLVVYPTDTAYAIGASATNSNAISKLLSYKGKRDNKPLSIMVSSIDMAKNFVSINSVQEMFLNQYKYMGLTAVLSTKNHSNLDKKIILDNSVAIRISNILFIKKLISDLNSPITATSANISFGSTPYSIDKLLESTPQDKLDMISTIIDIGEIKIGNVSSIFDIRDKPFKVIRQGLLKLPKDYF
ncbi:L-threonylcarbamoyladenylate synthase [Patescibacteria group bacterium]|nr:L-threonylcarbamoyladenylate synthase [Patescibacteria group bacterium]